MLKIKDNVDLKELERFGFSFLFHTPHNVYAYETSLDKGVYICVDEITRIIYATTTYGDDFNCTDVENWNIVLFDLIKAGLVEKVND